MKTFDEACKSTFVVIVARDHQHTPEELKQKLLADPRHFGQIEDEIRNSPLVHLWASAALAMYRADQIPFVEAVMAAFCQGVQVGMEMERAEPAPPEESVPGRRDREETPGGYTGV